MKTVVESLAERIAGTHFSDLPGVAVQEVKRHLLDVLGVILAGSKTEVGRKTIEFVQGLKAHGAATVVGSREKAAPYYAALANAAMGFHLELDDVHRTSHTHPGITTIPSALAVGEEWGVDGQQLIVAINAGYETQIRIGQAVSPSVFLDRVFLPCALLGSFGAAACACRLWQMEEKKIAGALGNVATLTPVSIFESFKSGTMAKEFMMGWTNSVGILCALMARGDIGGPPTAIEGALGFAQAAANEYDLKKITSLEGFYGGIQNTGMKPYACCRQHHTAIDAALEIRRKYGVKPEEIEEVIDRTFSVASRGNEVVPTTIAAAKYSAPYILAVALTEGKVWREQFSEEMIRDPRLLGLARKVRVVFDPDLDKLYDDKWPSIVEVRTKHGKTFSERYDLPKGEPEKPLDDSGVQKKFVSLATDAIPEKKALRIIEMVWKLEDLRDIRELIELLKE